MIKLICEGKVKQAYVKQGVEEFLKRLTKHVKVEYIEKDEIKESDLKGFVIALDVKGKEYSSEKFAENINKIYMENKPLIFLIGGADGLQENIQAQADLKISLSKLTYPNELVRVIFLEQLYRAFKIINNEPYHK
jgi:23S rRNA (pseudouridine1915-N3)-methyltransferase